MRYTSLRLISILYKLAGVLGALVTVVLFILTASGGAGYSVQTGMFGYSMTVVLAFVVLIVGLIGSLSTYAVGEFMMLMIDIEQGVRNIDHHFNRDDYYPADRDPLTPRPLADFPPSRFSNRPARTPEQVRRPGKWDMGK